MKSLSSISSLSAYVNNGCCTIRRMLIVVAAIVGLSVFMVLLQYYLTRGRSIGYLPVQSKSIRSNTVTGTPITRPNVSGDQCWAEEDHVVIAECIPCSDFEKVSKIKPCQMTGYYDKINCSITGIVYRACQRIQWLEERNFIVFLVSVTIGAAVFSFLAYWRHKVLDEKVIQKLQRQMDTGL